MADLREYGSGKRWKRCGQGNYILELLWIGMVLLVE
jgi:hypothetical protein